MPASVEYGRRSARVTLIPLLKLMTVTLFSSLWSYLLTLFDFNFARARFFMCKQTVQTADFVKTLNDFIFRFIRSLQEEVCTFYTVERGM